MQQIQRNIANNFGMELVNKNRSSLKYCHLLEFFIVELLFYNFVAKCSHRSTLYMSYFLLLLFIFIFSFFFLMGGRISEKSFEKWMKNRCVCIENKWDFFFAYCSLSFQRKQQYCTKQIKKNCTLLHFFRFLGVFFFHGNRLPSSIHSCYQNLHQHDKYTVLSFSIHSPQARMVIAFRKVELIRVIANSFSLQKSFTWEFRTFYLLVCWMQIARVNAIEKFECVCMCPNVNNAQRHQWKKIERIEWNEMPEVQIVQVLRACNHWLICLQGPPHHSVPSVTYRSPS